MRVGAVHFGVNTYAIASDGMRFEIQGNNTLVKTAECIRVMVEHMAQHYDVVIVEDVDSKTYKAHAITWFKKSMKRRFPRVRVIRADESFPADRMCSECCGTYAEIRIKQFHCIPCGHEEDRDLNAAKNLRNWRIKSQWWTDD